MIQIDDTKDKIRRNLILFAALIIVIPFWGLPITKDVNLWGLRIDDAVSPIKIWVTITAILLYLYLRYIFDSDTLNLKETVQSELLVIQSKFIVPILEKEMERYIRFGKKPQYILDPEAFTDERLDEDFTRGRDKILKIKATGYIHNMRQTLWENVVGFSVDGMRKSGGGFALTGGSGCNYRLPKMRVGPLYIKSIIRMATYSASGINLIFPFILFYCAWGYCWFRMSSILLVS